MSSLRLTLRTNRSRAFALFAAFLFVLLAACSPASPTPPGGTCGAGLMNCNGVCVDLASDGANCGQCGISCGALFCSQSMCSSTCAVGMACGQSCVDVTSNASHCGTCNNACPGGAACTASVCGTPPAGTGGGPGGTGGGPNGTGGSGAISGTGGGSGGTPGGTGGGGGGGTSLLGGYHVHGDWAGFAFTFTDELDLATIMPESFDTMLDMDGPYCVSGNVVSDPPIEGMEGSGYKAIAAVGFNVAQPKIEDAPVNTIASTGDGVMVNVVVNSGSELLRVQLEDGTPPTDPDAASHRWCANLTVVDGVFNDTLPWEAFSTECWAPGGETDVAFDNRPIAKVILYIPDPGMAATTVPFDFCVNDIGPANVVSRGTGTIGANCSTNVTWSSGSVGDQYGQAQTSDNRYQYQNNGWGWMGGGSHSASLLNSNGFTLTSQTCSRTDDSPCSFPSIYIGTDADGTRTANSGLPKAVSAITSAPTCMGWTSGGTPASHEFNVSFDVWFNTNAQATNASKFLMVWYRDPPSFQPGGATPIATAVIGDQTWQVWHGPNHAQQDITSYVTMAPGGLADGQAYSFDLKNFIDDAVERGYILPADNLIAVMGGMEIWGGGQGASINSFSATVN
jgi:hypothetical protein